MKGLLYKDFVNSKGYIAIVVFYMFFVFAMVETVVWDFTNASGLENKFAILSENFMVLLSCIVVCCLVPTAMATAICALDGKTKWTNYALALPGGHRAVVTEKYIVTLIGDAVAVIVSLAIVFIMKHHFEVEVDGVLIEDVGTDIFIVLMLLSIGVSLLGNSVLLPLICRSKQNWFEMFCLACLAVALYAGVAYVCLGDISFFETENAMQRIMTWIATHKKEVWGMCYGVVGAGILAQIISYVVTMKTYLKYA